MASYLYPCQRCSLIVRFEKVQPKGTRIICDDCEKAIEENERSRLAAEEEHRRQVNEQKRRPAAKPPPKVGAKK